MNHPHTKFCRAASRANRRQRQLNARSGPKKDEPVYTNDIFTTPPPFNLKWTGLDAHNERYILHTTTCPGVHPGWATRLSHKAFRNGETLTLSVCVTPEQAIKMHNYWRDLFILGPVPVYIEDIVLEEGLIQFGRTFYPRDSRYRPQVA